MTKRSPRYLDYQIKWNSIDELNGLALGSCLGVMKLSFGILPFLSHSYRLLPVAVSCITQSGPVVVSKTKTLKEAASLGIGGPHTTAYQVLKRFVQVPNQIVIIEESKLLKAIEDDEIDCALVLHDQEHQALEKGLQVVSSVLDLWSQPVLPLGGFFASDGLDDKVMEYVIKDIQASLDWAIANPKESYAYIKRMTPSHLHERIQINLDRFINPSTLRFSNSEELAIEKLCTLFQLKHQSEWIWKKK